MRLSVSSRLFVGLILASCLGCPSQSGRTYHGDPFASQPTKRRNDFLIDTQPPAAISSHEDSRQARPKGQVASARDQFMIAPVGHEEESADDADLVIPASANEPIREAKPQLGGGMDHAPDYSWIQGQLEYSALGGGVWKVRYAPISADDEHGGSVILDSDPTKQGVKPDDTVFLEGELVPGKQSRTFRNPQYRVRKIIPVD
jgi:hypothetical protein